jgi:exodeoxyribonuclease-3
MKIASYNVNGVNGRLPRLLEWLEETRPDVVCLQEIKTTNEKCPVQAVADLGYGSLWHGQRAHHGVAILARGQTPREIRRVLPGDDADLQARYLEAEIDGIVVASVYLPNGNPVPSPNFDYKLKWFERLNAHAQSLFDSGRPIVLAGDLNVVPTKADIYNEWLWREDAVLQPQTRDAWQRLVAQGWIDSTRHLHPDEKVYTFWVNEGAFRRNAGFRMDFLLLTPELLPRLQTAAVDVEYRGREKPSDHTPVWVELRG